MTKLPPIAPSIQFFDRGFGQLASNSNFGTLPEAAAVLHNRADETDYSTEAVASSPDDDVEPGGGQAGG